MTIRCEEAAPLLERVFDGEASPEEKRLIDAHVRECGACTRDWSFLERVKAAAGTSALPEPPGLYWEALPAKVMGRIAAEAPPSSLKRRLVTPAFLAWAGTLAAAIVAALTVPFLSVHDEAPRTVATPAPQPPPAVETEGDLKEPTPEVFRANEVPRRRYARVAPEGPQVEDKFEDKFEDKLEVKTRTAGAALPGESPSVGKRADASERLVTQLPERKLADLEKQEEGVPGPAESRRKASTLSAEPFQAGAPASATPVASADALQAVGLKESEKADPAEGLYLTLAGRLEQRSRLNPTATEKDSASDLERERAAWRDFTTRYPKSPRAAEALYHVARCSLRLYATSPTDARRKEAVVDAAAYLERVGSGEKFEEIRGGLERIRSTKDP